MCRSKSIRCDPCRLEFSNITAYEYHYESKHANVCSICQKIFPGAEWLKLHLDELHNVLLKLQKERGGKIVSLIIYLYMCVDLSFFFLKHKCYVETCSKYFSTPKMRRLHLIDKHKYPKHFPFDLVFTGTLTFEQLKKRDKKNKRRLKQREAIEMDVDKKPKRKNSSKQDPMDALAQEFNQKLKIPQTISFGRPTKPTLRNRQRKKKDSAMDIE